MRAQTTLDFAIGVTVFLAVLIFAFSFVPGILEPFEVGADENSKLSDRIADSLSQERLGSAENPHILDRYCTVTFFDESVDAADECNYQNDSLRDEFDLGQFKHINVTIEGNITDQNTGIEPICWTDEGPVGDAEPGFIEENFTDGSVDCSPGGSGDVVLTAGETRPEGRDTTISARRLVLLDGNAVTLTVVVW
jgi:hypothetical protein